MRFPFPVFLAVAVSGAAAFAREFVQGEFVWCSAHRDYVSAPHECDLAPGIGFCDGCEGYYRDVASGTHLHVRPKAGAVPPVPVRGDHPDRDVPSVASGLDAAPPSGSGGGFAESETGVRGLAEAVRAVADEVPSGILRKSGFAVAAAAAALFLLAALRRGRRSAYGAFAFEKGVPQGVALVPGVLVCEERAAFDGGTATGHRALFRSGRRWVPAFVKRMVGAGMRRDARFPALRFESDILRKLAGTEVVPTVFVPAAETSVPGSGTWEYYAMSVARGEPWPERGGLGRQTKPALHALCEALVKLHDRGVGHHDLKPQNVFWDGRHGTVTLLDFGSAIEHSGSASALLNPLGGQMAGTRPWVPPASDGRCLADLSTASDAWVYGLLFCEAVVGGIHDVDRTRRRWPEKPEDRDWLRERLAAEISPKLADAVVDGLFALQRARRMTLRDFLLVLRSEWEV